MAAVAAVEAVRVVAVRAVRVVAAGLASTGVLVELCLACRVGEQAMGASGVVLVAEVA